MKILPQTNFKSLIIIIDIPLMSLAHEIIIKNHINNNFKVY